MFQILKNKNHMNQIKTYFNFQIGSAWFGLLRLNTPNSNPLHVHGDGSNLCCKIICIKQNSVPVAEGDHDPLAVYG